MEIDGTPRQNFFTFTQTGSKFAGKMEYPWGGEVGLEDGAVSGAEIHFRQSGDAPSIQYAGKINNDRMLLTRTENGKPTEVELMRLTPGEPMFAKAPAPPPLEVLPSNHLAKLPPMGWNAWNHFHDFIDEQSVREIAEAMISSGMRDAGYVYVNIDDEWAGQRDAAGIIHPNRNFPNMKGLADYLHSRNMKLGLYSSPGPETCEGHIGSLGHEEKDAETYAAWGADYLKYDWCSAAFVYQDQDMQAVYQKMGKALESTGHPIVYSLCQYGKMHVPEWGPQAAGNLWRTTPDISDNWKSMIWIWTQQQAISQWNKPGGWNDPDMLEVGNGGMTDEEYRTHFSLWSMLSAPLIAGNDPRSMSPATLATLTNKEVIAIDQDPLASPPHRVAFSSPVEVWTKALANGDIAVMLLNATDKVVAVDLPLDAIDPGAIDPDGDRSARDLWLHRDLGRTRKVTANIVSHGVLMLRIAPAGHA